MAAALTTDPVPVKPLSPCEQVEREIKKYDWDHATMLAIAKAESGCNPSNHNLTTSETHRRADGSIICVGSYGALQVGCLHYNGEDKNDVAANVRIAYRVYTNRKAWDVSGYKAWSVFNNGKYKEMK